jgi:hypothetical protein
MTPAEKRFQKFADDLTANARVTRSTMMGLPCLRWDGAFFACLDRRSGALVVKLPEARVDELISAGHAAPFAPAGRRFRQWAAIHIAQRRQWRSFLVEAQRVVARRHNRQSASTQGQWSAGQHRDALDVVRQRERVEHP